MTRVEPGNSRTGRPVRGDRAVDRVGDRISERASDPRATGYSHRGTGRSIDDVRGRGREALAATRGANALALSPAVEPVRRRRPGRPPEAPPVRAAEPQYDEPQYEEPQYDEPQFDDTPAGRRRAARAAEQRAAERRTTGRSEATAKTEPLVDRFGPASQRARRTAPAASPSDPDGAPAGISVVPPLPVSAPRAPFVALVLSVVVVGVLGILVINTKINEGAFHLHDLRAQQGNLDQHEQRLQREIAERESPGNLAAAARQLGLVRADSPAFLRLPDGRQLGVPKPAAGPVSPAGQQTGQPNG